MTSNVWVLNANVGDTSYPITVSISPDGQAWDTPYDLANLPACPLFSPSLVFFNGRIHIAYQGPNNELVIASSADGLSWTSYSLIAQGQGVKVYTNGAPALTAHASSLFVAYADGNNHLVIQQTRDGSTQFNWTDPYDTGQSSSVGPSIAVYQGRVYMAFNQGSTLFICFRSFGEDDWGPKVSTNQSVYLAPSLVVFRERLFIAFVQDVRAYPLLVFSSADGTTWTQPADLNQETWFAPSLAVLGDTLFVSWIALPVVEGSSYINVASSIDGEKWSPYLNLNRSVGCAPSLGIGAALGT